MRRRKKRKNGKTGDGLRREIMKEQNVGGE